MSVDLFRKFSAQNISETYLEWSIWIIPITIPSNLYALTVTSHRLKLCVGNKCDLHIATLCDNHTVTNLGIGYFVP